jgi:translation initiation factor IF-2
MRAIIPSISSSVFIHPPARRLPSEARSATGFRAAGARMCRDIGPREASVPAAPIPAAVERRCHSCDSRGPAPGGRRRGGEVGRVPHHLDPEDRSAAPVGRRPGGRRHLALGRRPPGRRGAAGHAQSAGAPPHPRDPPAGRGAGDHPGVRHIALVRDGATRSGGNHNHVSTAKAFGSPRRAGPRGPCSAPETPLEALTPRPPCVRDPGREGGRGGVGEGGGGGGLGRGGGGGRGGRRGGGGAGRGGRGRGRGRREGVLARGGRDARALRHRRNEKRVAHFGDRADRNPAGGATPTRFQLPRQPLRHLGGLCAQPPG